MQGWQLLLDYWRSKHANGRAPRRSDLDPILDIPQVVPNLMLIDVLPDGFVYRLCGSAQVQRWNKDMTGKRVGAVHSIVQDAIIPVFKEVSENKKPELIIGRSRSDDHVLYILIAMPLLNVSGETECILAASFYEGDFRRGTQLDGIITYEKLV